MEIGWKLFIIPFVCYLILLVNKTLTFVLFHFPYSQIRLYYLSMYNQGNSQAKLMRNKY